MTPRALFLDRDGVINRDYGYVHRAEDFHFVDGIFDLARAAHHAGYLLIVVTNQAGIGRGLYRESDFMQLSAWMCDRFAEEGAPIADVYFCPCHPAHGQGIYRQDSFDRKPNPGMLLKAAERHRLDLAASMLVGDKASDMEAAVRAGVGTRCLLRLPGMAEEPAELATCAVDTLAAARELLFVPSARAADSADSPERGPAAAD